MKLKFNTDPGPLVVEYGVEWADGIAWDAGRSCTVAGEPVTIDRAREILASLVNAPPGLVDYVLGPVRSR